MNYYKEETARWVQFGLVEYEVVLGPLNVDFRQQLSILALRLKTQVRESSQRNPAVDELSACGVGSKADLEENSEDDQHLRGGQRKRPQNHLSCHSPAPPPEGVPNLGWTFPRWSLHPFRQSHPSTSQLLLIYYHNIHHIVLQYNCSLAFFSFRWYMPWGWGSSLSFPGTLSSLTAPSKGLSVCWKGEWNLMHLFLFIELYLYSFQV